MAVQAAMASEPAMSNHEGPGTTKAVSATAAFKSQNGALAKPRGNTAVAESIARSVNTQELKKLPQVYTKRPAFLFAPDASSGELWKVTHWHYPPCPTAGTPSFYSDPYHKWCTCSRPNRGPASPDSPSTIASECSPSTTGTLLAGEETIEWTLETRSKLLKTIDYRRVEGLEPQESADGAEIALKKHFPGKYSRSRTKPNHYRRLDCKYPLCDFRARVMRSPDDGLWYCEELLDSHQCFDGLPLAFQTRIMNFLKNVESSKTPVTLENLFVDLQNTFPEDPLCQKSEKDSLGHTVKQFLLFVREKQRFYRECLNKGGWYY